MRCEEGYVADRESIKKISYLFLCAASFAFSIGWASIAWDKQMDIAIATGLAVVSMSWSYYGYDQFTRIKIGDTEEIQGESVFEILSGLLLLCVCVLWFFHKSIPGAIAANMVCLLQCVSAVRRYMARKKKHDVVYACLFAVMFVFWVVLIT